MAASRPTPPSCRREATGRSAFMSPRQRNVILDINGYFAPASGSTLAFYPLPPCRVADTRSSSYPQGLGAPFLPGLQQRDFPILQCHELQHSVQRSRLFAELFRGAPRPAGLLDGLAHGPVAAAGFDPDGYPRDGRGQCGHCACGYRRRDRGLSRQRHRLDH